MNDIEVMIGAVAEFRLAATNCDELEAEELALRRRLIEIAGERDRALTTLQLARRNLLRAARGALNDQEDKETQEADPARAAG